MPESTDSPISLRERKKALTRASLIEVSQRLFAQQGYPPTTLEAICREVEISVPTLLRYFPSKAALAVAPSADAIEPLIDVLQDPERGAPAIEIWSRFVAWEAGELSNPSSETGRSYLHNLRDFSVWADPDSHVVAAVAAIQRRAQDAVAAAMVHDAGAGAHDLHSTLVAALLVQGRLAVYRRWLAQETTDDSIVADQLAVIDYAVESLPRRAAHQLHSIAP